MRRGIRALAVAALVFVCVMEGLELGWRTTALEWLKELEAARYEGDPRYAPVPKAPVPKAPVPSDLPEKVPRIEPLPPEAPSP
jgi:hypothetical protein